MNALLAEPSPSQSLRSSSHTLHTLRTLRPTCLPNSVHLLVLGLNVIHQHLWYINHPHAGGNRVAKAARHRQPWHVLIRQPHPESANGVVPVSVAGDAALRGRCGAVGGVCEEVWAALACPEPSRRRSPTRQGWGSWGSVRKFGQPASGSHTLSTPTGLGFCALLSLLRAPCLTPDAHTPVDSANGK